MLGLGLLLSQSPSTCLLESKWSRYCQLTFKIVYSKIAAYLAQAAPSGKSVLIDAFAGAGGNTISFALSGRWERIFAIEKDSHVLQCAKHNAAVYGVANKIWWIEGDCFDVVKKQLASMGKDAVIFASPPWGGRRINIDYAQAKLTL